MRAFLGFHHEKGGGLASAIRYGFFVASLALAAPAFAAGGDSGGSGGETPKVGRSAERALRAAEPPAAAPERFIT